MIPMEKCMYIYKGYLSKKWHQMNSTTSLINDFLIIYLIETNCLQIILQGIYVLNKV